MRPRPPGTAASLRRRPLTLLLAAGMVASLLAIAPVPATAQDELSLSCDAPRTVTEGHAFADGPELPGTERPIVSGKSIQASAAGGDPAYEFEVESVTPEPESGEVTVEATDGGDAEVRFSDDVPGLDPIDTDGMYTVNVEVTDGEGAAATCEVDVRVAPVLDIGTMRGAVPDDADGRAHNSPYALGDPIFEPHGEHVAVRGVVTQRTLEESGGEYDYEGFFLQSVDADPDELDGLDPGDAAFADGDPETSDGVWVAMGTFPTLRLDEDDNTPADEQYDPQPGDVITVRGPIVEDFDQTIVDSPFLVDFADSDETGVDLGQHIEVADLDPPDDLQEASVHFERRAGMQTRIADGAVVVSGNDFFGPSTSEFWVVDGDHPVAQRENPDERRVFRDYHPLATGGETPEDRLDQGGHRMIIGSFGVKAAAEDATELVSAATSGQALDEDVVGGLFFGFDKYQVMPAEQPQPSGDHDPAASSLEVVEGFDPADEWSVMVYNVENLYDFRSDPFSGCDLDPEDVPPGQTPTGECAPEEDGGSSTTPPFDYAPSSQSEYDEQRTAIAEQITEALEAPDIITIQEAEKQDVCVPVYDEENPADSYMDCELSEPDDDEDMENTDRGSGAPDTIEELALEIYRISDGEVRYEASGDAVNGRDVRGITQGFMHRTDRVELVPADELGDDPVLGAGDTVDIPYPEPDERTELAPWVTDAAANPKAVNAELPQSALDLADELGESIDGGRHPQTQYVLTRAAQVAKFRVHPDGVGGDGEPVEYYLTSNHMSAGPDGRTAQRTEQARLNAAVAEAAVEAGGQTLITGDFNVFPRPDDPFPSFATDPDREPSDQLAAVYERGFDNLHDAILDEAPENTYSFIYEGTSQILDHVFVDEATSDELVAARYIHVNTDFPADGQVTEPGRGASDHDPLYGRFAFEPDDDDDPGPPDPDPPELTCPADEPDIDELTRLDGENRVETVIQVSQERWTDECIDELGGFDHVVLTRADVYADALAGTPLAAELDAPILVTASNELYEDVADEIERLLHDGGTVYLLGGSVALDDAVEAAVTDLGFDTERIAGETRYETAGLIAERLDTVEQVLVATGLDHPDALAAGAAGAANAGAVLLTFGEEPHEVVDAFLAEAEVDTWAIGGAASTAYPELEAVAGATRDGTAIAVAETFFDDPDFVGIARRDDFPDALGGGAHIGPYGGPVVLSYTDEVPSQLQEYLGAIDTRGGYLYGGTAAVDEQTFDELADLINPSE